VIQGFLDAVVVADLATAKTNGYIVGQFVEAEVGGIIAGINR
jgi:hypothetical protein